MLSIPVPPAQSQVARLRGYTQDGMSIRDVLHLAAPRDWQPAATHSRLVFSGTMFSFSPSGESWFLVTFRWAEGFQQRAAEQAY